MKRTLMQAYVKGSVEAVAAYQKAFGAKLVSEYKHDDGTYYHSELDVGGQIVAVSEAGHASCPEEMVGMPGTTMQFCLHFEESEADKVKSAFEALSEGSKVLFPMGPCGYCALMVDFVDRFGVRWCLFA